MRLAEPKTTSLCPGDNGSYLWFKLPGTEANQQHLRLQVTFANGANATDWDFDVGAFRIGANGPSTDPADFNRDITCFASVGVNEDCNGTISAAGVGPIYVRVQKLADSAQETVTMTVTEVGQGGSNSSGGAPSSGSSGSPACTAPTNMDPITALEMPLGVPFTVGLCPQGAGGLLWWKVHGTTSAGQNVRLTATFARGAAATDWDFWVGAFPMGDAGLLQGVNDFNNAAYCLLGPGVDEDCSGTLSADSAGPIMVAAYELSLAEPEEVTLTLTTPP